MKCSAALTKTSSSSTVASGLSGTSVLDEEAEGGSGTSSELKAPEKASCVALATCFSFSMLTTGSDVGSGRISGRATLVAGRGTGGSEPVGTAGLEGIGEGAVVSGAFASSTGFG